MNRENRKGVRDITMQGFKKNILRWKVNQVSLGLPPPKEKGG